MRLIKQILQYIQENYEKNVTLGELAEVFHMSEGQFCRFFKSQVGMTAIEYLNYYRIGVSCDRLRESDTPISEIAMAAATTISAILTEPFENICTAHRESIG